MKYFAKIVNGWIQSIIFAKGSILDVSLVSEYVSDYRLWIYLWMRLFTVPIYCKYNLELLVFEVIILSF